MDSVMEKFDLQDFFNLIIAGSVFLMGLGFSDNNIQRHLNYIMCIGGMSTFSAIMLVLLFVLMSYVAGAIFNALGWIFDGDKYQNSLIKACLTDSSIVGNLTKLDIYKKNAKDFFLSKEITYNNDQLTDDQCNCFFAHCVYFIQAKAQNQKAEKLRDVQGLSKLLAISFAALFFVVSFFARQVFILVFGTFEYIGGIFYEIVKNKYNKERKKRKFICLYKIILIGLLIGQFVAFLVAVLIDIISRQQITIIISGFLAILFYLKFKKDVSNRVRLILAVYDICKDVKDSQAQKLKNP